MDTKRKNGAGAISYEEILFASLQDPKEAIGYLHECLADNDPRVYLLALQDVIMAHRGILPDQLMREIAHLYDMLAEKGGEQFQGMHQLLCEFDIKLPLEGDAALNTCS